MGTLALAAGDPAQAVALSEERLAILKRLLPPKSDRLQDSRFRVEFLRVMEVVMGGGEPNLTAVRALVAESQDTRLLASMQLRGLVAVVAALGNARDTRDIAAEALALRNEAARNLVLTEAARDQFLRDGLQLTEYWLNASFDLARDEMRSTPGAPIACAGPEQDTICVILRIE